MKNPLWSVRKRLNSFRRNPKICRYAGSLFLLDPKEGVDKKIMAGVPFEPELLEFASSTIIRENIRRVVDIGANFGLYAVVLGNLDSVRVVDAFEPVRRTFNQLTANVFLNRLDAKVALHNFALGSKAVEQEIHIAPISSGLATFNSAARPKPALFTKRETVSIRRGDDALKFSGEIIYGKIDVEGFTINVLQGLPTFLSENSGYIQIEAGPEETDVVDLLDRHGWRRIHQLTGDAIFRK